MGKILITGMNSNQCKKDFFQRQQLKVVPSHYSLFRCLEDMGYEVEQREVRLGEDLSGYDDVIVFIHTPEAFCQFLWSGLYAVAARPDCIIALDDWQFNQIIAGVVKYGQYVEGNHEKSFKQYFMDLWQGTEDKKTIESFSQSYVDAYKIIEQRKNRLLVSAFGGGDLSLLKSGWAPDRMFSYNPNPYHLNRRPDNNFGENKKTLGSIVNKNIVKKKEWNFASLLHNKTKKWLNSQNDDWKWNINFYGAKRGEHKSTRLKENEMCQVFQDQWGCLMPSYFHAGSGWWRARPLQVADAGSIIVCNDAEGKIYGDAYVGVRASDVEQMDDTQLTQLAKDQHDCLYDNHPLDKKVEREELAAVLGADK